MTTVLIKTAVWGGPPAYEDHYSGKCSLETLLAMMEGERVRPRENDNLHEFLEEACSNAGGTAWSELYDSERVPYNRDTYKEDMVRQSVRGLEIAMDLLRDGQIVSVMGDCEALVMCPLTTKNEESNEEAHAHINDDLDAAMRDMLGEPEFPGEGYDEDDWDDEDD